jgi:hypothetical protein
MSKPDKDLQELASRMAIERMHHKGYKIEDEILFFHYLIAHAAITWGPPAIKVLALVLNDDDAEVMLANYFVRACRLLAGDNGNGLDDKGSGKAGEDILPEDED